MIKNIFGKTKIEELNEENEISLSTNEEKIKKIEFQENNDHIKEKKIKKVIDQKHYIGHRARLKEKIMTLSNLEQIKDYELLEMLLTFSIPRNDVKPLAKELLAHFKTFKNIFLCTKDKLNQIKGIGPSSVCFFSLIKEVSCRMAKDDLFEEVLLNTPEKVINYCKLRMSGLDHEQFRILFLNRKNKLIADECIQAGTIDKAAVFPREIVKRAIDLGTGAIILVHNHPSGDPTPSNADIETTINIKNAAKIMEIYLYDHLIIGKNKHYSMRSNKLL